MYSSACTTFICMNVSFSSCKHYPIIMHIPPVFFSHHLNPLARTSRPSTMSKIDSIQIWRMPSFGMNTVVYMTYLLQLVIWKESPSQHSSSAPGWHEIFQSTGYPKTYLTIIFPKHGIPDAKKTDIPLCQSNIFKPTTSTLTPPVGSHILGASPPWMPVTTRMTLLV